MIQNLQRTLSILGLITVLIFPTVVQAKSNTVKATGVAALAHLTAEEAQALALKRARQNAIEAVCGVSIQAQTFIKNNMLESDFIHSVAYGRIVAEEILQWNTEMTQPSKKRPPQITYTVTIKATVRKEKGAPDPFYQVNCRLNKRVFHSGDEMIIQIKVTKPSYISVLNYTADGSVFLLFPNRLRRKNHVKALQNFQIPSEADRHDVLKLVVSNLPGHRRDTEFIQVIATREPIHLLEGLYLEGQYGMMENSKVAATEIARLISSIPLKDRAEHTVFYEIIGAQ